MRTLCVASALVLLAGLPACTVGPNYTPPKPDLPASWSSPLEGNTGSSTRELSSWWQVLNDPVLTTLIDRALQDNKDLAVAQARIAEARAIRGVIAADQLPTVDATGDYSRSRNSDNSFNRNGGGSLQSSDGVDTFRVGLGASWEVDLWGRIRRQVEAADADVGVTIEDRRGVMVSLVADVATAYVDLRAFQKRLDIARQNLKTQQETVTLSQARFQAGLSSELDVSRATAQLATTQSTIPSFEAGVRQSIYRLGVLLGQQPGALVSDLQAVGPIPAAPERLPVGLPPDLLRRRPDLRSAERSLAAATARVGVATADLYPRLQLLGGFGLESSQFGQLFDMNSRYWNIGPNVTFNLFDRSRIRSNIAANDARVAQAQARFENTVLRALEEVDSALVAHAREQERRDFLAQASAANQRSVDLANQLYSRGLTDFFSVLDTQRQLFQSQDQEVQSEQQVTRNLIALYRAMGGGWDINEPGGSTAFDPKPEPPQPAGTP